ncbi:IS110 family RNA-guided transposase [Anaerosinus massiliensis]|uniref:IS110 family transposase n=1 Tax=Massilibacillus massiliensis TaxID=1806837 RepID=UPI001F338D18|nr:IS110 family transposase [Massilibacillus massiliensis]
MGIDVSKGKSTVCILKPYGEIIQRPFEIMHTVEELTSLVKTIKNFNEETRVVLEATGYYHLPVLAFMKENGIFVSVVNPLVMKKYINVSLRKAKTDKIDAGKIANFGIDHWFDLTNYRPDEKIYDELKILGRQYIQFMGMYVKTKSTLTCMLDRTMPGIKDLLKSSSDDFSRNKIGDFAFRFWHYDIITNKGEKQFVDTYVKWANKKGYQANEKKAHQIYALAQTGIPTLPSSTPSTKMLVQEAVKVLLQTEKSLHNILARMNELAKRLKEYRIVRAMPGVGEKLAPRLIAEIGDVRRFHNGSSLIAYAGLDTPPYESGRFTATKRKISKRGSSILRKTGYEVMKCLKTVKPDYDNAVYKYILKKESEGKPKKVAKIAGLNKFLRIYYTRVKETIAG